MTDSVHPDRPSDSVVSAHTEREEAIERIMRRTGKTREQAVAFLDVLGSAMTRRGLANAKVLSEDEIGERVDTFIGEGRSK